MLLPLNLLDDRAIDVSTGFILMASQTALIPSGPSPHFRSLSSVRALVCCNISTGDEKILTVLKNKDTFMYVAQ